MRGTAKSYRNRAEYRASLNFAADVVIIMLDANDSNGEHRHLIADNFEKDYRTSSPPTAPGARQGSRASSSCCRRSAT